MTGKKYDSSVKIVEISQKAKNKTNKKFGPVKVHCFSSPLPLVHLQQHNNNSIST